MPLTVAAPSVPPARLAAIRAGGPVVVGRVLRAWRDRRGLAAADAAALVGVSRAAWYQWEAGRIRPRLEVLVALLALEGEADPLAGPTQAPVGGHPPAAGTGTAPDREKRTEGPFTAPRGAIRAVAAVETAPVGACFLVLRGDEMIGRLARGPRGWRWYPPIGAPGPVCATAELASRGLVFDVDRLVSGEAARSLRPRG